MLEARLPQFITSPGSIPPQKINLRRQCLTQFSRNKTDLQDIVISTWDIGVAAEPPTNVAMAASGTAATCKDGQNADNSKIINNCNLKTNSKKYFQTVVSAFPIQSSQTSVGQRLAQMGAEDSQYRTIYLVTAR